MVTSEYRRWCRGAVGVGVRRFRHQCRRSDKVGLFLSYWSVKVVKVRRYRLVILIGRCCGFALRIIVAEKLLLTQCITQRNWKKVITVVGEARGIAKRVGRRTHIPVCIEGSCGRCIM